MITLYDYLPSQNAWKVRQLLKLLDQPYERQFISIFEGAGRTEAYREINPWGAVPAIRLEDGRVLSESNAILWYLSGGSPYRPEEEFAAAKVMQWLSFEVDYIQNSVGSLRFWALTGKMAKRSPDLIAGKRAVAERALAILNDELKSRRFIVGDALTIADISLFAYAHRASEADLSTDGLASFNDWVERVRAYPGFLAEMHPYSIDPHSSAEL